MVKSDENKKKDDSVRAVGRRKTASARVQIKPGKGKIVVNEKELEIYFPYKEWQDAIVYPLKVVGKEKSLDISVKVSGGGQKGQAMAVQHGIARSLVKYDETLRALLKAEGLLTRDARIKERKKPGLKKARRAPQWSKR